MNTLTTQLITEKKNQQSVQRNRKEGGEKEVPTDHWILTANFITSYTNDMVTGALMTIKLLGCSKEASSMPISHTPVSTSKLE